MVKRPDSLLKALGMSGLQIVDDIKDIEKRFGVDFGVEAKEKASRAYEEYEQFSSRVRAQASEMSEYYEIFFCLENTIRGLIEEILRDQYGANWWSDANVSPQIREDVKKRKDTEIDTAIGARSEKEIDYTTFGELTELIVQNWEFFEPIFTSKNAVYRVLKELNILRGPIAHCCTIDSHERQRLLFAVKNWFRIIS